jgi:hypothetical protein
MCDFMLPTSAGGVFSFVHVTVKRTKTKVTIKESIITNWMKTRLLRTGVHSFAVVSFSPRPTALVACPRSARTSESAGRPRRAVRTQSSAGWELPVAQALGAILAVFPTAAACVRPAHCPAQAVVRVVGIQSHVGAPVGVDWRDVVVQRCSGSARFLREVSAAASRGGTGAAACCTCPRSRRRRPGGAFRDCKRWSWSALTCAHR